MPFHIEQIIFWISLMLIAGESFLLLLNLRFLKKSVWATRLNTGLAGSDIIATLLLAAAFFLCPLLMFPLFTFLFLSHLFRYYQTITRQPNPFCFNTPLVIVNHIKAILVLLNILLTPGFN